MAERKAHDMKCSNCGHVTVQDPTTATPACPVCGANSWNIEVNIVENVISPIEEFGAVGTNPSGKVVAERQQKGDGITDSSFAMDSGQPSRIAVTRSERIKGFKEEGAAADTLLAAYNKLHEADFIIEAKTIEDSDYADRVLVSRADPKKRINVQIRNWDTEIISSLGKAGRFSGDRSTGDLISSIEGAIADKAKVDPKLKANTVLLLNIQTALGIVNRQDIQKHPFDVKGFREVWVAPFQEDSFRLSASP